MPRAVWTGTLTFGLVTIPVRLFPATESKDVRFHLTDERGRRVRYRRFVEEDAMEPSWAPPAASTFEADLETEAPSGGATPRERPSAPPSSSARDETAGETEVGFGDLMRGYETDDGRLVLMSPEEIESVRPERSRTIEIEDFVELADIDPVFFEKSYVVAPQRGAEKPYAVLLRAAERAGRVGIGRFVLRTKPHLVAIRPRDGALGLETLFFGDEVRDARALAPGVEAIEVSERELDLAATLIETIRADWDPSAYSDTYREELLRRISEKAPVEREAAEEEAGAAGAASRRAEELMEALKASVEAAKRARKKPTSRRKRPA